MTDEQMVETIKVLVADSRFDAFVPHYLQVAKDAAIARLWPYKQDAEWSDVPAIHHTKVCEMAVYLVNRRGSEGETSHSESGVTRSYESADIPDSYFRGFVSHIGVPS